jgi:CO/xanthine dehydrogenase Mo-binding subunit
MTEMLNKEFSRKSFIRGGGAMIVGFSLAGAATAGKAGAAFAPPAPEGFNPSLTKLDSWLRINENNTVQVLTSQGDPGNGISTGFLMVAAEELDLDMSQMINGTSAHSNGMALNTENDGWVVAQTGGIGGSNSMSSTGHRIRAAAVAARAELLKLASGKLNVPVAQLTVAKGVVSGGGQKVTYGELVGGKLFNVTLTTTSLQHGDSPAKPVSQYKLVGTKAPRVDIPSKVSGKFTYTHSVRIPGMLHARWVRPSQGPWLTEGFAKPLSVDASSIKHLPDVRVVQKGDFLAVVGKVEYQVVQAASQLKVKWAETPILPGHANLWSSYRKADSAGQMPARITANTGNFDNAFRSAAKTVSGSFYYAYNGHTPIGPACAVADYKALGGPDKDQVTVIFNTQNINNTTTDVQQLLGLARPSQVRMIFYEGSSTFGNGYHYLDISGSAALISKLAGAPVRMQTMRWDEQGWTRYGPAIAHDIRAGVDANGNIVAFEATAFAQASTGTSASRVLANGQVPPAPGTANTNTENLAPMYKVARNSLGGQGYRLLAKTQTQAMGMFQNGTLRAPSGPQTTFASEQIIDMLAIAANMDPYTFRIKNIDVGPPGPDGEWQRYAGVLTAAVEAAKRDGYVPRVSGSELKSGKIVSGWGMAVGTHNDSYAATVAHVTVNKETGKVLVNHLYAGQDSGFIINPDLIMNQMTGSVIQSASKVLYEELQFDKKRVTSRDWVSYPILRFKETPKVTNVIVHRPDREASGSGEPPLLSASAAIPNAIFDATGVRMTHAPLTPARVRGFLKNAGK